jgi:hypothetical protein
MTGLVAVLAVILPHESQAGMIYTDRSAYDAAVAGFSLSWSEDFEGFALGSTPVPTIIGGGAAEIAKLGSAEIIANGFTPAPGGANEWLGVEAGFGETIQGLFGASLGINAIGFDYYSELGGSYNFNHSGGVDSDTPMPDGTPLFVGWVGSFGEVLDSVDYTPSTSAHILDDIVAQVIPEPASIGLLGLVSGGIFFTRRIFLI